jgi:hypothetical protein
MPSRHDECRGPDLSGLLPTVLEVFYMDQPQYTDTACPWLPMQSILVAQKGYGKYLVSDTYPDVTWPATLLVTWINSPETTSK